MRTAAVPETGWTETGKQGDPGRSCETPDQRNPHYTSGYSCTHPYHLVDNKAVEYIDPVTFLDGPTAIKRIFAARIASDGDGVNMRVGPRQDYTAALQAHLGDAYYVHNK